MTRRGRLYVRTTLVVVAVVAAAALLQLIVTQLEGIDVDLSFTALSALVHRIAAHNPTHLLAAYGYWAVLLFVGVESTGIPFPGETMLLAAAIYAGTTHRLALPLVIAAAAAGAILGDNLGFWVGREGGYRLLRRYGRYVHLDERKLKLGMYLFQKHGGKVVFFGRFIAVLRVWAAFLAGTYRLSWPRFLLFNATGGLLWATLYGAGGYLLGQSAQTLKGPVGIATAVLAVLVLIISGLILRRHERRLADEAERALPGPLDAHQRGRTSDSPARPLEETAHGGTSRGGAGNMKQL